jgi:hypothetical protein
MTITYCLTALGAFQITLDSLSCVWHAALYQLFADQLENTLTYVAVFVALDVCFNKLLCSCGCLCDTSMVPKFCVLCHIVSSLRLLVPKTLQIYYHFIHFEGALVLHLCCFHEWHHNVILAPILFLPLWLLLSLPNLYICPHIANIELDPPQVGTLPPPPPQMII